MKIFLICGIFFLTQVTNTFCSSGKPSKEKTIKSQSFHFQKNIKTDYLNESQLLKISKILLLNGEFKKAELFLSKLTLRDKISKEVLFRYLGTFHFLKKDYQKSLRYLSHKVLQSHPAFSKICLLKTLNEIALKNVGTLGKTWSKCKLYNQKYLKQEMVSWVDILISLRTEPQQFKNLPPFKMNSLDHLNLQETLILFKMGLFLNQEDILIERISDIDLDYLENNELREIIGQLYFRKRELQKSFQFIEDLSTPHSLNMIGNLYLLKKDYSLAYENFKHSYKLKSNSLNALERLIPLSWNEKDWKKGIEYLEKYHSPNEVEKKLLMTAFNFQNKDFTRAHQVLESLLSYNLSQEYFKMMTLGELLSLKMNDFSQAKMFSHKACLQNNLISCWVLLQLDLQKNFLETTQDLKMKKKPSLWSQLIKQEEISPLEESIYINQKDIEELDEGLIELIPKSQLKD